LCYRGRKNGDTTTNKRGKRGGARPGIGKNTTKPILQKWVKGVCGQDSGSPCPLGFWPEEVPELLRQF